MAENWQFHCGFPAGAEVNFLSTAETAALDDELACYRCSRTGVRSMRSQLNRPEHWISDKRGRRPKPTRMKVFTGNPENRPMNRYEPKPEPIVPDCPAELGPVARQQWDRLANELGKLKILTVLDRAALAAYGGPMRYGRKRPRQFRNTAPWSSRHLATRSSPLMSRLPIVRQKS